MKRRTAWSAAGVMALVSFALPLPAAEAVAGCQVDYRTLSEQAAGFRAAVEVKNVGAAIDGWALRFAFSGAEQQVARGWNGSWTQSGAVVTAANLSRNATLASGSSITLGFDATAAGSRPAPVSFQLNGADCTVRTAVVDTVREGAGGAGGSAADPVAAVVETAPALRVAGNRLVTAGGGDRNLYGVNRSGGEFACIKNRDGIWNGPMDQESVSAMRTWKIRTVRVPLNEECWLGTTSNPVPEYSGAAYQNEVKRYVGLLIENGITPVVELHWTYGDYSGNSSGCPDVASICQKPMPDAQYTPAFWTSVATTFKGNDAIIFDLFNEPYPERATGAATSAWKCWRDGGTCPGIGYQVAGFQSLVDAVRATGATNVLMLGGIAYSNDLTQWLTYRPTDPLNNVIAMAHVYNFNACASTSCWDSQFAPVAAQVPLVLGEIGENDCAHSFIDGLMNWADAHRAGYLGWTWNNWDCSSGPALISDYNGTPTAFGEGLRARLAVVSN
jgi:endoglucanase